jgi:hypothetical protein
MSKVAVFGIGPSGMVAAWAALEAGHDVVFYSNTIEQSKLYGCQYLHAPIPLPKQFKIPATRVDYKLNGSAEDYRRKVYGAKWDGSVSPEDLVGEHDAWDIRATYNALWRIITQRRQVSLVAPVRIDRLWLQEHTAELSEFAHVISTIPAFALCENPRFHPSQSGHMFRHHRIMAAGSVTFEDPHSSGVLRDLVECDGTGSVPWYRRSTVFGYTTMEWAVNKSRQIPADAKAVEVRKPLDTECDCHPEIVRMGRFGEWKKGVLVHNVYGYAQALMREEYVS